LGPLNWVVIPREEEIMGVRLARRPQAEEPTERRTLALLRKASRLRARARSAAVVETVETVGEGRRDARSVCAPDSR